MIPDDKLQKYIKNALKEYSNKVFWDGANYGGQHFQNKYDRLYNLIKKIHEEHADDLCWMDIDLIFKEVGLPVPDRSTGDPNAMLKNCEKFIRESCIGGKDWKSYKELEEENKSLQKLVDENDKIICALQSQLIEIKNSFSRHDYNIGDLLNKYDLTK